MSTTPLAYLGCPKCEAVVDFSKPMKDDDIVICGKCGYSFGTRGDVNKKAQEAIGLARRTKG